MNSKCGWERGGVCVYIKYSGDERQTELQLREGIIDFARAYCTLKGGGGCRPYCYQANRGQTDRFRSEGAGVSRGKEEGEQSGWRQLLDIS